METTLQEPKPTKTSYPPETRILVLCDHGRSRSATVQQILIKFGYSDVAKSGIKPPGSLEKNQLIQHDLIIVTQEDVLSQLNRQFPNLDQNSILLLPISEADHQKLAHRGPLSPKMQQELARIHTQIKDRLQDLGFTSHPQPYRQRSNL